MFRQSGGFGRWLAASVVFACSLGALGCNSKKKDDDGADSEKKGKKESKDESTQEKKKSPLAKFVETANDHLRKREWKNAADKPPGEPFTGTMTTKRAHLTDAEAKEYPDKPIPRPAGGGTEETTSKGFYSSVRWHPSRREVAVLELCFQDPTKQGPPLYQGRNMVDVVGPYWETLTSDESKKLVSRTLAGVLSGKMSNWVISRVEKASFGTEEYPDEPLKGALFISEDNFPCTRIVSPEAKGDKAFLSSVIEKGNWPDLEKKL